jgi:hypothetical protein
MKNVHQQSNRRNNSVEQLVQSLTIIATPVAAASGHFAVRRESDARLLVRSSATPFCAAARALLSLGHNPSHRLVMRHKGSEAIALASMLGTAAQLTVNDNTYGMPKLRRLKPAPASVARRRMRPLEAAKATAPDKAAPSIVETITIVASTTLINPIAGATGAAVTGTAAKPPMEATAVPAARAAAEPTTETPFVAG